MRGKVKDLGGTMPEDRITPAHAGKSFHAGALAVAAGDHPRACGEKLILISRNLRKFGSPPRMRGKDPHLAYYR